MKNQELKKMSLANIENRLTLEEMENVMAGSGLSDPRCTAEMGMLAMMGGMVLGPWGYGAGLVYGYFYGAQHC